LVVIVAALAYRNLTGQSKAMAVEEKVERKELEALSSEKPGDEAAMAKKLASQAEELNRKEQLDKAKSDALRGLSQPYQPYPNPGAVLPTASLAEGIDAKQLAREKAELDAAEEKKRLYAIRSSKIVAWEDGGNIASPDAVTRLPELGGNPGQSAMVNSLTSMLPAALGGKDPITTTESAASTNPALGLSNSPNSPLDQSSTAWASRAATQGTSGSLSPLVASTPLSAFTLHQGSSIPAVLLSAIDAELPGDIVAMTTRDVYDSVSMRHVLVPKGSKLLGSYNHEVAVGQERILFGFSRLIFPDGVSVNLTNMRGADTQGNAGLKGEVDNKFWTIFGSSLVIGAISNLTKPLITALTPLQARSSDTYVTIGAPATDTAAQSLTETSSAVLQRYKNIKPSMRLPAGQSFNLMTTRDIILRPDRM
jgi:type IV secretory pathway VirB10-like protein